jgi:2,5-diketo-D-gluconate reductase A
MEKLVDAGLVKNIGVCNCSAEQLRAIYDSARIKPAVHQLELQPGCPNTELLALHKELGIVTTAYCPLGVGFGPGSGEYKTFQDPDFIAIAEKHGQGAASFALQWNLQLGNVVLTKSVTPSRIAENAATPVGGLSDEAMAEVASYGKARPNRVCNPQMFHASAGPFFL